VTRHGLSSAGVADAGVFLGRLHRLDRAALVRLRPAGQTMPTRAENPAVPGSARDPAAPGSAVPSLARNPAVPAPEDPAGAVPWPRAAVLTGGVALWARLPWGALVTRTVDGSLADDATVAAGDLLAVLSAGGDALPARRDSGWRWPLPPAPVMAVESVPAATVRALGAAAERALRTAAGERHDVHGRHDACEQRDARERHDAGEHHDAGGPTRSQRSRAGRVVGERAIRDALLDHVPIMVEATEAQRGAVPVPGRVEVPQRLVQAVVRMGFLGRSDLPVRVLVAGRSASRFVGLAAEYGTSWYQKPIELSINTLG